MSRDHRRGMPATILHARRALAPIGVLLIALGACMEHTPAPSCVWPRGSAVTLTPPSVVLARGDTVRIDASFLRPRLGSACPPRPFGFTWHSSDTTIASVDASGLVTARDTGQATITVVTLDGSAGTAGVRVRP